MERGLPLYDLKSPSDASHRIAAPGGYEWWHFDAESADQSVRVVVMFWQGDALDGQYARRYRAYVRRPTWHRPPLPREYAVVHAAVFERDRLVAGFASAGGFSASGEAMDVTIADCRASRESNGDLHLSVRKSGQNLSGDLTFRPVWPREPHLVGWALPTSFPRGSANGGQCPPYAEEKGGRSPYSMRTPDPLLYDHHHWLIADPLCVVESDIHIGNRAIKFTGRGYHDHHFGDRPLWSLRHWMRGRVLGGDKTLVFQAAEPVAAAGSLAQVFEADANGLHLGEAEMFSVGAGRWTLTGLGYPSEIRVAGFIFVTPKILDHSPARLLIAYRNRQTSESPLLCEIIYPSRVAWPF